MVGGDQPADLAGMQPCRSGDVLVRAGFAERNLAQGLEDGDLRRRQLEPALQVVGIGKWAGRAGEILIEPAASWRGRGPGRCGAREWPSGGAPPT